MALYIILTESLPIVTDYFFLLPWYIILVPIVWFGFSWMLPMRSLTCMLPYPTPLVLWLVVAAPGPRRKASEISAGMAGFNKLSLVYVKSTMLTLLTMLRPLLPLLVNLFLTGVVFLEFIRDFEELWVMAAVALFSDLIILSPDMWALDLSVLLPIFS